MKHKDMGCHRLLVRGAKKILTKISALELFIAENYLLSIINLSSFLVFETC